MNVKYQEDKNLQNDKDHKEKVEEYEEIIKELKIRNKAQIELKEKFIEDEFDLQVTIVASK